jgi:prepilin-type processing-associated H-X9-DG protein
VPPNMVDQSEYGGGAKIPMPYQNFSQVTRLLPYLEQQVAFNALNWSFGSRWSDYANGVTDNTSIDGAAGGAYSMVQYTVLTMQISTFLCPSDQMPGSSGTFSVNGAVKLVGASNYPSNIGLNRRINGAIAGNPTSGNWQENGPGYLASTWDGIGTRVITINSFTDGTSNTAIFSEWVKGSAISPGKNNLGEVYYFPGQLNTASFATDFQFNQACQVQPINANQAQHWKGEWWAYSPSQIYSHTVTPNRYCCEYQDQNPDGRATITAQNASSNHPGGVNVLFMDGSVRFIKTSVSYIPWYAIATPDNGEVIGSDQL